MLPPLWGATYLGTPPWTEAASMPTTAVSRPSLALHRRGLLHELREGFLDELLERLTAQRRRGLRPAVEVVVDFIVDPHGPYTLSPGLLLRLLRSKSA